MKIRETDRHGVRLIEPERHEDDRGFFARTWCVDEFQKHGLNPDLVQCSVSFNRAAGTVRGMHWQASPHGESKLVRCTAGAILDVVVDVRPESATYLQTFTANLTAQNHNALYIPEGFAHGFQTLEDGSEVFYQISSAFCPDAARGMRWNDPSIDLTWPIPISVISDRDANYPDLAVSETVR